MFKKIIFWAVITLAVVFGLIQLVPYGKNHTNPLVVSEPKWDSPRTQELAKRACYDCHSNETIWPWYANIAPVSWLVQVDVDRGRQRFNISEGGGGGAGEAAGIVQEGEMPPFQYLIMHPLARLTAQERQDLATGLQATFGR
jgi:mono/diheme cytochrome c family protein